MNLEYFKGNRYKAAPQCPCGKNNRDGKFVPYLICGTPSKNYGFCHSCGKTFLPNDNNTFSKSNQNNYVVPPLKKTVPPHEMIKTLKNYELNNLVKWLEKRFPYDCYHSIKKYHVGTNNNGGTLFWHISINDNVLNAKNIFFDQNTGRRIKNRPIYNLYSHDKGYSTCLFAENLLKNNHKTVALVESEKTAIISNIVYPDFTWLATGGANGLTYEKARVLKSSNVIYIPDCDEAGRNSIEKVSTILKKLNIRFKIMDNFFKDYNNGEDIVDLIIDE